MTLLKVLLIIFFNYHPQIVELNYSMNDNKYSLQVDSSYFDDIPIREACIWKIIIENMQEQMEIDNLKTPI